MGNIKNKKVKDVEYNYYLTSLRKGLTKNFEIISYKNDGSILSLVVLKDEEIKELKEFINEIGE